MIAAVIGATPTRRRALHAAPFFLTVARLATVLLFKTCRSNLRGCLKRRAALLAGVWVAFLGGALLASAATPHFASGTLLPPTALLAALAAFNHGTQANELYGLCPRS
jgi:hypothetical protein